MGLMQEFKAFAMRGNVMDLAVGVVIGGAFGKIVTALVDKIIMPITALLTGGINIADKAYPIPVPDAVKEALASSGVTVKETVIGWGAFVQSIIDFVIIAFAIFMVVKIMNAAKKKEEAKPAPPSEEVLLLREIRDSLKR